MQKTNKKSTASDQVAAKLEEEILKGTFKNGTRLPPEREIQKMYGNARSTIRIALGSLQEKGLIEIKPGSGAYVKQIDISILGQTLFSMISHKRVSYRQLTEFRQTLEYHDVVFAVERATKKQILTARKSIEELEQYLSTHQQHGDINFYQQELDLHVQLARMSGNPLFEWFSIAFMKNTISYREEFEKLITRLPDNYAHETVEDWKQLIDAVEERSVMRAISIINKHHYQFIRLIKAQEIWK